MTLFSGHSGAHGTHGVPVREIGSLKWAIKSTADSRREPPTLAMWKQHLAGKRPLGIIPIRQDSTCSWGSIDVDEYDANLLAIITQVDARGLPLVPCRSKSGGLHLFLFLEEPQPAGAVQSLLRDLAASLGRAGDEIFPKQTQILEDKGDVGNWMVMPYYGDTYGGKIREQVGLRKTGAEMTAEEFCDVAEKARVPTGKFISKFEALGKRRKTPGGAAAAPVGGPFSDGPPCLQHLAAEKVGRGQQSNALLMMGIYFKRLDPANWKQLLEDANREHLDPPGSAEGLTSVMRSLEKKDYEYTCRNEPMVSHCNSSLCRTRRHGVGEGGNYPLITGLSKLNTEPPIWFVDLGTHRIDTTTEQLSNYILFHRLAMEKADVCYALMKPSDWLAAVAAAMQNLTVIPAPPEVGITGRFMELLVEFLTNRAKGDRREDILSGRPFEDLEHGKFYFRLKDLIKFLKREDMKELGVPQVSERIRRLGGASGQLTIKDHNTAVWWVPSVAVTRAPTVEPARPPGSPI